MLLIDSSDLKRFSREIFVASGVPKETAGVVANSLVEANLRGHDSHGVIRITEYANWMQRGWVNPVGQLKIIREQPCILILDGQFGFGQLIGRQAMELAIPRARRDGICVISLRRSGHLGRVGEFMEMAASAGLTGFGFTNTHGGGVLVAPHGGCERRLSANPIVGGAPMADGSDLIMDISTSTTAEGKIKVARNKGMAMDPGLFVNGLGQPSTDPEEYYQDPPGALLPMAGHKGFALSMFCEVFAGAMTGAGCSRPGDNPVANGWMAFLLNPEIFSGTEFFAEEMSGLAAFVRSSRPMEGFDHVRLPGEPENEAIQKRSRNGIPIDETTWSGICRVASEHNVDVPAVRSH